MITLYRKGQKNILVWRVWSTQDQVHTEYGIENGLLQHVWEQIEPKASRSLLEQIDLKMNSMVNKKLDSGYVRSKDELKDKAYNLLGLEKPMLAARFDEAYPYDFENAYFQYKYDGHRCLIKNDSGELIAYSRNGKIINTIDHILQFMEIPEGVTVDGELYCHGLSLQTITSLVKRRQQETESISFHCYDAISNSGFVDRYNYIKNNCLGVEIVPTLNFKEIIHCYGSIKKALVSSIEDGYEGLIMRLDGYPYEDGKRSKSLVKIKKFLDDEFKVIDIIESKTGMALLQCKSFNGRMFSVTAPGNEMQKRHAFENRGCYIGRQVTIEYQKLTDDGIPFHPIATKWKEDL